MYTLGPTESPNGARNGPRGAKNAPPKPYWAHLGLFWSTFRAPGRKFFEVLLCQNRAIFFQNYFCIISAPKVKKNAIFSIFFQGPSRFFSLAHEYLEVGVRFSYTV